MQPQSIVQRIFLISLVFGAMMIFVFGVVAQEILFASNPLVTVIQPSPSLSINQMTATSVIATATQAYIQTQAPISTLTTEEQVTLIESTPSLAVYQMTATSVIATATQNTIITPTPIPPIPTLTTQEVDDLRQRWRIEMEQAAGFSHPIFDFFADELSRQARQSIDSHNWGDRRYDPWLYSFSLDPQAARVTFEGVTYVAVSIRDDIIGYPYFARFLLFQMVDNTPILMPNPVYPDHSNLRFSFEEPAFADRNANGYPDLAISNFPGMGSSMCMYEPGLVLLEFRSGGAIIDITPPLFGFEWKDLDNDGIREIMGYDTVVNPSFTRCDLLLTRWFRWDGEAYRDISANIDESYYPAIGEYWAQVDAEGCYSLGFDLYQMLLDYYARGYLPLVWELLKPLLETQACSERFPDDVDPLELVNEWIKAYLPEE